jgi:DNA polymerase-2
MEAKRVTSLKGWLFDVYADRKDGLVVWFIGEDGQRYCFRQEFPIHFYVGGDRSELRAMWRYLRKSHPKVQLEKVKRKDLFEGPIDVLAIRVQSPSYQPRLFRQLHDLFPGVDYYDADLALPIRYHCTFDVFPMAYSQIRLTKTREIASIRSLDDRWTLEAQLPDLRILGIEPDSDPRHSFPSKLSLVFGDQSENLSTKEPARLLSRLSQLIDSYDPDFIVTRFGDQWLFPHLFSIAKELNLPFNPNRDKSRQPIQNGAKNYSSYGRMVHQDKQTLLRGRAHIDPQNSLSLTELDLAGTIEQARVTGLTLQKASRRSTGGGFTAMQIREALQNDVLVPLNKKQRERYKSAAQLVKADNGGIIFQPIIGLHRDVAEIDFFSMYPSLMSKWNISPETVGVQGKNVRIAPGIEQPISQDERGIVSSILQPVLEKRRIVKQRQRVGGYDPAYTRYLESTNSSLKGLGWVSYGYQGFSGNRIGSIEAHEAINAVSRELILRSKEVAENWGSQVLHMYVDSLFVTNPKMVEGDDFMPMVNEMSECAEIELELEGVFRWLIFLPSKQDPKVPVPNSFFGAFKDGRTKIRGIMARRDDTPLFIKDVQMSAIKILARVKKFDDLRSQIPKIVSFLKTQFEQMQSGEIPVEGMSTSQRLSKNLEDYKVASAAARAAQQLVNHGKTLGAGQRTRFLRVIGDPDVIPLELFNQRPITLDYAWYQKSFLRAAHEVLQTFGVEKEALRHWLLGTESYFSPEDYLRRGERELPLFETAKDDNTVSLFSNRLQ